MRIVMVTNDFLPNIGGMARHVHELSKWLSRAGHSVAVVIPRNNMFPTSTRLDNFSVEPYGEVSGRSRVPGGWGIAILRLARHIGRVLGTYPDIVHWHSCDNYALAAQVAKCRGRVFTNHSSGFLMDLEDSARWGELGLYVGCADRVIGPSEELCVAARKVAGQNLVAVNIPNCVDPDRFRPDIDSQSLKEEYGLPSDRRIVLCARRLVPKNGVVYLAQALARLGQWRDRAFAVFAGDGPERDKVQRVLLEAGWGASMKFLGDVDNNRMPELVAGSYCAVFPSLLEATSIAALEAMAAGRPVIATRVGGLPEIVADGVNGLLVGPRDSDGLAAALDRVLSNGDLAVRMGCSGRNQVLSRFSWAAIAARTVDVYEGAIAAASAPSAQQCARGGVVRNYVELRRRARSMGRG